MTETGIEAFESFFSESFAGAVRIRELRLSSTERDYIASRYPRASLKAIQTKAYPDDKLWFEVVLHT
ncbi:hypothetical protein [Paenibacillus sp. LHD-38]|uniref:hypothetical protein n=1 Tax=Paenibacillus sp. LHD-38 TaxID=3072143 RepID=UPI00280DF27E|nr:hypothetical protein [Paenibacillus sp. LHD-38]MDQ8737525.1 hypothetical protein [Paenibacillus sp. LHD-38]